MVDRIRILIGRVISNKMNKSAVVSVERLIKHSTYGKFIKRTTKLHIHDPNNETSIGDIISVQECRPISKTKSWILTSIIKKSDFF
ncbi:30S ribosomal protein S17 [Candidatus Blochmannia vicinus]|uniref:Small ribosomal subunit protein uS17 n=1 Tax=Candidatus Blochmannia vicinus (nom. nud.) TaxID=251540 RepID=A0A9Q8TWQ8_9ENTR|nr:30S ribosomal protein S17 [Candidatus Blochmannia vicinus]URJ27988.1 30S ribosomal protein S17 [Candidatus Blochmannia vicinus]URJ30741.1 30S ribosomal protein S17 [Candidatus Blochmannia vicinus]URJ32885.1 30S ribosomal protein S17 [Candidatus Blochmannia vicinus]